MTRVFPTSGLSGIIGFRPAAATPNLRHVEYFADHARLDRLLFEGVLDPKGGVLRLDLSRFGMGLEIKRADAERYRRR
jgi:hypothetical protein